MSIRRDEVKASPVAAISRENGRFELILTGTELGAWMSFFLKYYRDGHAEVNHMDVDAHPANSSGREATIVVRVDDVGPGLSPDELRKRLGL